MLIRPHTLSLITTHQCTAACDHCCFNCSPRVTKSIPTDRLRRLVDEAVELPSIRVIVFTGGECFLLGELLDELVGNASKLGFKTRCVTNGYWATSPATAAKRIDRLSKAGLTEINFSTGSFHSKFVQMERIVYGAVASARAGIPALINVETFADDDFPVASIAEHADVAKLVQEGRIAFTRSAWIKGDGEQPISHPHEFSRFRADKADGCKTAMNVIAVTPDVDVVACCGLHMERIPDLHIGNAANRSLRDVLTSAPDDFLKIWLHVAGPERILQFVQSIQEDYQLPLDSAHPCESCLHLYKDPVAQSCIQSHHKKVQGEILPIFLAGLTLSAIDEKLAG